MTKDEFKEMVRTIRKSYPDKDFLTDHETFDVWFEHFKKLRNDYVAIAVKKYVSTERFLPSIADIVNRYKDVETHNKKLLQELREIFQIARQYYPSPLWRETDEVVFMAKIKSKTFSECREKAEKILRATKQSEETERTFTEFIEGLKC